MQNSLGLIKVIKQEEVQIIMKMNNHKQLII